jgi:two-component system, cell cycle response regulator
MHSTYSTCIEPLILPAEHEGRIVSDGKPPILLVEDEPTSRLLTARRLTKAGYAVHAVHNGREALAALQKAFFPMLLTDWDMPEMNGADLCRAVRAMPLEGYVYIIVLTAREGKNHVIEGLSAGADDYLIKPSHEDELRARLNVGLRIVSLEQSLRTAAIQSRQLSVTDALTNAYNRRYLMERLPQEIHRACRYGRPLSVVLCDIDHFKDVNDQHGHQIGDRVLAEFAAVLVSATRRGIDWVARYGGEEFVVVLPETTVASGAVFAEKIRSSVRLHSFGIRGGALSISSSFGVSGFDSASAFQAVSVDTLISEADRCLYHSKESGRNKVTVKTLGGSAGT